MSNYIRMDQAAAILKRADRVMVIGNSGTGKSTLAAGIAKHLELENISIDRDVTWLPGWIVRDMQEQRTVMASKAAGDRWVMDGTSLSSFDLRLPRADLVLWLRAPSLFALWGVLSRAMKSYGKVRPDMAPGCPERLPDMEFLRYIWSFEKIHAPKVIARIETIGPEKPVFVIKTRKDMRRLLALVATSN